MRINNGVTEPSIHIQCAAKAELKEGEIPKLGFQGYSGDSVDLSDYGFDYPVVYNIAGIETKQQVPIRYNHGIAIGHSTSIRKVENGSALRGKGLASLPGADTERIVTGIKNGFPWQGSMGLRVPDYKTSIVFHEKGTVNVNNRTFTGPMYVVNKSVLTEMTITESGRDSNTSFEFLNQEKRMLIKNASPATPPPKGEGQGTPPAGGQQGEGQTVNNGKGDNPVPTQGQGQGQTVNNGQGQSQGQNNTTPTQGQAQGQVENPTPSQTVNNGQPVQQPPVINNGGQAVHQQINDPATMMRVLRLLNAHPGKLEMIEKGIGNGWDDESIENSIKLHELNSNMPKPPSPGQRGGAEFKNALEARMCLSFGSKPEHLAKKYGKELTDHALTQGNMGIRELLVEVANSMGGRYNGFSDVENMCTFIRNTGYSTFDLPEFFERVGETLKEERWEIAQPFAPQVCKTGSNSNFNIHERIRPTGGEMWNQVAADGKIDLYAPGGLEKYQTVLETYGALFTITRREVINDDQGVINDMMDMMIDGAMMIPDYQWGQIAINQAAAAGEFWQVGDNSFVNLPLTRANLAARYNAIRQFNEKKNGFNWNMMLSDRWRLIISPNLEEAAWDILKQDRIMLGGGNTDDVVGGDKNFWFGKLDILVFPQMANTSVFTSGSKFVGDTTWILVPSSERFAPWEITYLRGMRRPRIERVDLPATLLGFGTRGYWDVKVNERDRRATSRQTATP